MNHRERRSDNERDRGRGRERERETDSQTDRQREGETERETETETEREKEEEHIRANCNQFIKNQVCESKQLLTFLRQVKLVYSLTKTHLTIKFNPTTINNKTLKISESCKSSFKLS